MLIRCVQSIHRFEPGYVRHIVIVDDASPYKKTFETLDMLRSVYKLNVLRCDTNAGYSHAINTGCGFAKLCGASSVVTINSDIECLTPFVARVNAALMHADVVGALLLYPTGRIQHAGYEIDDAGVPVEYDKMNYVLSDAGNAFNCRYVMGVTGAFQAFRLEAGRYSTDYSLSYEDVEFCLRQWREGKRVFYEPNIYALHMESATRGYHVGERELKSLEQFHADFERFNLNEIRERISLANRLT